jgi:hypothetical protein
MSIDDISLPGMLRQLANDMETLHHMQDWASDHGGFDGSSLTLQWGYGQHTAGFDDVRLAVQAIVRERYAGILREALDRKDKQVAELHENVRKRMTGLAKTEGVAA